MAVTRLMEIGFVLAGAVLVAAQLPDGVCSGYNWSPCVCESTTSRIVCTRNPIDAVKTMFANANPPARWDEFVFYLPEGTIVDLPSDLTGAHNFRKLTLYCPNRPTDLTIDADAFRQTAATVTSLYIGWLDMARQADFAFLNGFVSLSQMTVTRVTNLPGWVTLPESLPQLVSIQATYNSMQRMNLSAVPGGLVFSYPSLQRLEFYSTSNLADGGIQKFFKGLQQDVQPLALVDINNCGLTSYPDVPPTTTLVAWGNRISALTASSPVYISATDPSSPGSCCTSTIGLHSNGLNTIEAGSIRGDFRGSVIAFSGNSLNRLDQSVFEPILQEMAAYGGRNIAIPFNPIDCTGCGLAWLVRDNRQLLPYVSGGTCSDGTTFEQLDPNAFDGCVV